MSVYLITGAGFLTREILKKLLPTDNTIRIISRGAKSLDKLKREFGRPSNLRLWVGDIQDKEAMVEALNKADYCINTAAEKLLDWCEECADESTKVNFSAVKNVCRAAAQNGVKKMLQISTDKAYQPETNYGYAKQMAEQHMIHYNRRAPNTMFSAVRYGNVWGSSASVVQIWDRLFRENKALKLTHPEMTRFFISPEQSAQMVLDCIDQMKGGEIFIPKLKSVKLLDVIRERYEGSEWNVIGMRGKEKMHELLEAGYSSENNLVSYLELMEELKKERVEFYAKEEK